MPRGHAPGLRRELSFRVMSMGWSEDGAERFELAGRADGIVLGREGVRHPRFARGGGSVTTPYAEITHVAVSDRIVWIGTTRTVYLLRRQMFRDARGGEKLVRALLERLATLPGGAARLARMAEIDALARDTPPPRATWSLAALCLVGYVLSVTAGSNIFTVGYFSPVLVADGDLWRLATGNLLHGFPLHLILNLVGLLAVGRMIERALGAARTLCVMGTSALGAMIASALATQGSVVGASGVVFGLAGGVLWIQLRCADRLPVWWRFPRSMLFVVVIALICDGLLGLVLPFVAGAAHFGGFAAGLLTTAAVMVGANPGSPARAAVRAGAAVVAASTAIALLSAGVVLLGEADFEARHAARLAELPGVSADELNNHAWFIAIDADSTRAQLDAALLLAQKAVSKTERRSPTILDTLAEVQFRLGWTAAALATIDEAIASEPEEPYYREQRRRFTGERAPDDRPPDPAPRLRELGPELPVPPDAAGVTV